MSSYTPRATVTKVKPIIRKFNSEKEGSLDLDRSALEQPAYNKSASDVTFTSTSRTKYHMHTRSTSGASHQSTATTGSGQRHGSRHGSFIHPFQQRPYTPPPTNSFQHSDLSREAASVNEDEEEYSSSYRTTATLSNRSSSHTTLSNGPPMLKLSTKSHSSSRLGYGSSSNLHTLSNVSSHDLASPAETVSPLSTVRSSFDKGFMMRSHSLVDSGARFETVHEARRAFQEREDAKAEKIALEEARAAERKARRQERADRKSIASDRTHAKSTRSKPTMVNEKTSDIYAADYNGTHRLPPPQSEDQGTPYEHDRHKASTSTKRKTQSTWTLFIIWFRTRLLRMKSR